MSLRFSAQIRFVTPRKWSQDLRRPGVNERAEDEILMCHAGVLYTPKGTSQLTLLDTFHYFPSRPADGPFSYFDGDEPSPAERREEWGSRIQRLLQNLAGRSKPSKKSPPPLRAVLIGGQEADPYSKADRALLQQVLSDYHIPYATIAGQSSTGESAFWVSPRTNAINICQLNPLGLSSEELRQSHWLSREWRTTITDCDQLFRCYREVQLAPGDELILGSKRYDHQTLPPQPEAAP